VNVEVSSYTKFQIFRGSTSDPAGGAYSAQPDLIAGEEGLAGPPQELHLPLSGPSGLGLRPLWAEASFLSLWGKKFSPLKINLEWRH